MAGQLLAEAAETLLVIGGAVFLGGLVRGATGFGGALVMVPLLATVTTPAAAVSLVLLIDVAGYADMLRHAGRRIQWRAIGVLTVAAIVAVPLGVYAVTQVDTAIMTRVIAGCVVHLALILMTGWRYTGTLGPWRPARGLEVAFQSSPPGRCDVLHLGHLQKPTVWRYI